MGRKGFSLMEVMVTVVIVGILAAIAIPSYTSYVTRTRRAEAVTALQTVALYEEKARAESGSYVGEDVLVSATYGLRPSSGGHYTPSEYYSIVIGNVGANTFTAYAVPAGVQESDATIFALDQNGTTGTALTTASAVTSNPRLWNSLRK